MKELKAPDKVVQKMTRDGAVAENLATGETESISGRDPETDLSGGKEPVATAEAAAGHIAQTEARRSAKKQAKAEEETIREESEVRQRPPYRLQFTDEERADPAFQKYIRHSDKAANKLDAAKEAIPTRKVLKTERVFDEAAGRGKTRLAFEEVEKRPNGKLRQNPLSRPVQEIGLAAHNEVHKVEQENVGVEAGHKGEELAERGAAYAGGKTRAAIRHHRMKPWRDAAKETFLFVKKHSKVILLVVGIGACVALLFGGISSCSMMAGSGVGGVFTSSYLSEDTDMLAAENAYLAMEAELHYELDNYESLHPGYDEYRCDLDDIKHDPYVLISILTAFHEGVFTIDEVQAELEMLFEKQYILTETVETETRYRTETRTGTRTVTDPETGETSTEEYEYEVQMPYTYYICNVKLENFDLSHVPVYIMGEETLSLYATYMSTLGNREDLFPSSSYVGKYTNPPATYDIPASALEAETFAALITEAEKYIGYPYVWGGSNPNTSFDCSGFVSWVLTESGVCNTGRLGAQGLYNISTPVSSANARPGDLIFFVGTYDTPGVSHVGIYVGGGKMLHCGDPIQYADINTSYWQSHFYAFGRPPYN